MYENLLNQLRPEPAEYPACIEGLNAAAFDINQQIADLADEISALEELASAEASAESNADKRKARKAELLRDDERYASFKREIRQLERDRFLLQERSHRYAREFRLIVAEHYAQVV